MNLAKQGGPFLTQDAPAPAPGATAWAVTSGEDGMRTQARGLAAALAGTVIETTTARAAPWRRLRDWARPPAKCAGLSPPWPDVMVTCGRHAIAAAQAVRAQSGGRTLMVHIQDPRGAAGVFDLIIAMDHDRIAARPGVIKVTTALHDLDGPMLRQAAEAWRGRFASLGEGFAGVVVGGDLRGRRFTREDGQRLIVGLERMRRGAGLGLAITPSRRTPPAVCALMREAWRGDPGVFLWDLAGDNPYRAILGSAERLVVTSDSVSMVSEAISTDRPVDVLDLGFRRHAGFVQALVESGRVRRFDGDPAAEGPAVPVNATTTAAAAARALLDLRSAQAPTGMDG